MKKIVKNMMLILFIAVLACFGALCASAEYELTITSRSMNVGLDFFTQVEAEVEGAEIQPEIIWSSSDEAVATVNSKGIVTGKALGSFEVIATAEYCGETLTARFPMKVVKNENPLNSYMESQHLLSYQYSYDYCGYYYANDKKSWQDNFGFAGIYDFLAKYVRMEYDSLRTFFTYDNKDFMIQIWKGQYFLLYGGEIGVYHRDADGLKKDPYTFYYASEEEYWPVMDMAVYHQKQEGDAPEDYEILFRRPTDKYWWCTGFVPGTIRNNNPADELRIEATLTFRDEAMATLFADELGNGGLTACTGNDDLVIDGYYREGNKVVFSWQNVMEPDVELDWRNAGTFIVVLIIYALLTWGFPELVNAILK